jgi:general secretion pathway protein K
VTALAAPRDRGIAIVAALWASAILAVIVVSVLQLVRADAKLGRGRADVAELGAIADAAVNITVLALLNPKPAQWPVNGAPVNVPFAGHDVRVSVQDEAGKIDLNTTGGPILRQLMIGAGLDAEAARGLAEGIVGWRESDERKRAGTGSSDVSGAGHGPRHALFQSVEELQLVPGMTRELYRRIAPLLTVYSQAPWIDPAVSSVAVLTVLSAVDNSAETELRRLEEERLGVRPPAASPGVVLGHAYTITAELQGAAAARVVRTAIVRVTGQPVAPLLIYRWG